MWNVHNEYKITFSAHDLTVTKMHLIQIPLAKEQVCRQKSLALCWDWIYKLLAHTCMNNVAFHITDV